MAQTLLRRWTRSGEGVREAERRLHGGGGGGGDLRLRCGAVGVVALELSVSGLANHRR